MAKKDFSRVNVNRVHDTIAEATAEPGEQPIKPRKRDTPPTEEEIQLAREQSRTRGRKGVKMLRINMAFTPDVHEYIRTMAQVRGQSVTQFTESVFRKSMEENAEIYAQAKAFRELL